MIESYGYDVLIEKFLKREIAVLEFESAYLDLFKNGDSNFTEEFFSIVEWLFFEVDAYTDLPLREGDDPDDYINEDQLRESAAKTLQKLKSLT